MPVGTKDREKKIGFSMSCMVAKAKPRKKMAFRKGHGLETMAKKKRGFSIP